MFKKIAEKYNIDENTMRKDNLRFLFWLLIGSVPLMPLIGIVDYPSLAEALGLGWIRFSLPDWAGLILAVGGIASFLCLIAVGCNKLINRLCVPNKYLDEWEIQQKQASMSFAFQFLMGVMTAIFTLRGIAEVNDWMSPSEVSFTVTALSVTWVGFYAYAFHVVTTVRPVERDEFAEYDWQQAKADQPKR